MGGRDHHDGPAGERHGVRPPRGGAVPLEWEDAGRIPRELHRAAARQGLLGIGFAEEVGGEGGDLLDTIALQEAMFAAGVSSGLMAGLFTHGIALPHLAANGSPDLVDRYLRPTLAGELIGALAVTEPGGGSDVAAPADHGPAGGGRRRPVLPGQRHQDVHHQRRARRLRHHRRPHGRAGARRASRCWSSTRGRRASPSTAT